MLESGKATAAMHAGLISAYGGNDLIDGDLALINRCGHDALHHRVLKAFKNA